MQCLDLSNAVWVSELKNKFFNCRVKGGKATFQDVWLCGVLLMFVYVFTGQVCIDEVFS